LALVIRDLERAGFRPRIQDAWRSPEDQLRAFQSGNSKLKFGYHNATGPGGEKEALAVDLLDDDAPIRPTRRYLLALAIAARDHNLSTGLAWDLPANLKRAIEDAIKSRNVDAPISKIGWDPCHLEITGISVADVKRGKRP
jgi:hypothetical protein